MTPPDLPLGRRVYLDANIYIYLFEGFAPYRQPLADLTADIDRRSVAVIASELIFVELLPRPLRDGRGALVSSYLKLMQQTPQITLAPVDRRVIEQAVQLRADLHLRSMDALHLATAIVHGCETFLTNDQSLRATDRIRVLTLRELVTMQQSRDG